MPGKIEMPPQERGRPFAGFEPFPGAVVIARLRLDDRSEFSKSRPALVLSEKQPGLWMVMPFTTRKFCADGTVRESVLDAASIGLDGSYLRGGICPMTKYDTLGVAWAATHDMLVGAFRTLRDNRVDPIERAARLHAGFVDDGWRWPKPGYESRPIPDVPRYVYRVRPEGKERPLHTTAIFDAAVDLAIQMSRRDLQTWVVASPERKHKILRRYVLGELVYRRRSSPQLAVEPPGLYPGVAGSAPA